MGSDVVALRRELVRLYEDVVAGRNVRSRAGRIYAKWREADAVLDEDLAVAVRRLVDLAWETGVKVDAARAEETLVRLKKLGAPPRRATPRE